MVDHTKVKLGRTKPDPKKLLLTPKTSQIFTYKLAPSLPSVDYTLGHTNDWGMHLNGPNSFANMSYPGMTTTAIQYIRNGLGCCTIAGLINFVQVVTLNTMDEMLRLPDYCDLQKYCQWAGFDINNPQATDQGAVETNILEWYMSLKPTSGLWGHRILNYADPTVSDIEHVKKAIEIFGAVYIGLNLPTAIQGSQVWDAPLDGQAGSPEWVPGSWGGHCVIIPKYTTDSDGNVTFYAISWGELYEITQAFWLYNDPQNGQFVEEVHAPLSVDWLGVKGTPEGLDLSQLTSDLPQVAS